MNWTEKDLDLFKSRRQRGTRPAAPHEFRLHVSIADILARWCSRDWRYTHIPLGEYRTPATAGRLKRMGVMAGWPDFIFVHCKGRVCFLELKRSSTGKQTDAQERMEHFLRSAGHDYCLTSSFERAIDYLRSHGIVPARIANHTSQRDTVRCAPSPGDTPIE